MSKAVQIIEGQWVDWHKREKWRCCDCALVHKVETRVRDGQLQLRMFRDDRATAQSRRWAGIEVKHKRK